MTAMAVLVICSTGCNKEMDARQIKENPHRHELYHLKIVLQNAPRAPDSIDVQANYQVQNDECTPRDALSGARPLTPHKRMPLRLSRGPDGALEGDFYLDPFLDEDYFGLGMCRWSFTAVGIDLTVGKGTLAATLTSTDVRAGETVRSTFPVEAFQPHDANFDLEGERNHERSQRPDEVVVVARAWRL
jgi:hypothetical protein